MIRHRNQNIYAMYKGDTYICEGTLDELAAQRGISYRSMQWYLSPSSQKRIEQQSRPNSKRTTLVLVEEVRKTA